MTYIWYGFFAPKQTPADIVNRLNAAVDTVTRSSEVVQKLDQQGVSVETMKPSEFGKFMASETEKWREVISAAGIKGE